MRSDVKAGFSFPPVCEIKVKKKVFLSYKVSLTIIWIILLPISANEHKIHVHIIIYADVHRCQFHQDLQYKTLKD